MKIANLVYSKMLHVHMTCEIQNQRQDNYFAYFDHTRLFPLRGCAISKPEFLMVVQSLKLFR